MIYLTGTARVPKNYSFKSLILCSQRCYIPLKMFLVFFFLPALMFYACSFSNQELLDNKTDIPIRIDGKLDFVRFDDSVVASINIEIADTPETQTKGLMGRSSLDYNNGMLFVFESLKPQKFLMKNTAISLDIIFVGEKGCVVNIAESATPMSGKIYRSNGPIKYVVEVKTGFVKHFKIDKSICIRYLRL